MTTIPHLLFFGSLMKPEDCQDNPDCPFSSNRFQYELLRRLHVNYARIITALCPAPMRSFPHRRLLVGQKSNILRPSWRIVSPSFINLGPLKVLSLILSVYVTATSLARRYGKPQAILLYNPYLGYSLPALLLSRLWRIPVIGIVADLNAVPKWKWRGLLRQLESLLQRWAVLNFTALLPFSIHVIHDLGFKGPFMRISPGIEAADFSNYETLNNVQNERVLLFSGTLNRANGLKLLLDTFKQVRDMSIQLWISGRGEMQTEVELAARRDPRIHYWGFLTRIELLKLMQRSHILVNPRPAFLPEHRYNFPSKILEYLAVGRPVISTATSDVAQEYGDYLVLLEEETPFVFARLIESVSAKSLSELDEIGRKGRQFVLTEKNWAVEGESIAHFLARLN